MFNALRVCYVQKKPVEVISEMLYIISPLWRREGIQVLSSGWSDTCIWHLKVPTVDLPSPVRYRLILPLFTERQAPCQEQRESWNQPLQQASKNTTIKTILKGTHLSQCEVCVLSPSSTLSNCQIYSPTSQLWSELRKHYFLSDSWTLLFANLYHRRALAARGIVLGYVTAQEEQKSGLEN